MVDEAHALGVVGKTGHGLSEHFGCGHPDLMMGTLSKALGSSGGYIAGSKVLVEYLRQKSRPYIFNTAPTPSAMASADAALSIIESEPWRVETLREATDAFLSAMAAEGIPCGDGKAAIAPVLIGDEFKAVAVSKELEKNGYLVPAIRYPTVAKGQARLRVALNAMHKRHDITSLAHAIGKQVGARSTSAPSLNFDA